MKTGLLSIISLILLASTGFFGYKYYDLERKCTNVIKIEQSVRNELDRSIEKEIEFSFSKYHKIQEYTPKRLLLHFDNCVAGIHNKSDSFIKFLDSLRIHKYQGSKDLVMAEYNKYKNLSLATITT